MEPTTTDWIQAVASLFIMVAAITALIIAWKAPRLAAKFAEEYRSQNAAREQMHLMQLHVFLQLMAHRAELANPLARQAVNSVDVIFAAHPEVRSARQMFMAAVNGRPTDSTIIVERYHSLIEAVARAVGIANLVGPMDIRLGYYPEAAGKLDLAAIAEAEEKIARREAVKQSPNEAAPEPPTGALDAFRTPRD